MAKLKKHTNIDQQQSPAVMRESLNKILNNDLTLEQIQKRIQFVTIEIDHFKIQYRKLEN